MRDFSKKAFDLLDSGRDEADLCDSIQKLVARLPDTATGNLRAFDVVQSSSLFIDEDTPAIVLKPSISGVHPSVEDEDTPAMVLKPSISGVHPSVEIAANHAWAMIGGNESPDRASSIIAAARWEFSRSQFLGLAYALIYDFNPLDLENDNIKKFRKRLSETNWSDTDAVARAPEPVWGDQECAAHDFSMWLQEDRVGNRVFQQGFNNRKPFNALGETINETLVLSAIALGWIDEAAFNPSVAFPLMAEAYLANGHGGFLLGSSVESSAAKIRYTNEMRKRGRQRWEGSPTQKMQAEALDEYKRWQLDRSLYRYPRDFRREMQRRFPEIVDGTLKNWMSAWGKEQ